MTQTIALVASSNGLGHTRRLAQLASGIRAANWEVHLLATQRNIRILSQELRELGVLDKTLSIPPIGLDSYLIHGERYLNQILETSTVAHAVLKEAEIVISDNSLWPVTLNSNVWTFGHFLWTDYYKLSSGRLLGPVLESRLKFEVELEGEVRGRFLLAEFNQSNFRTEVETYFVPMLRYLGDDPAIYHARKSEEIWVSLGTTGLSNFGKLATIGVMRKETNNFKLRSLPKCVIGRAGLGTIRDCLAFSVPFFPIPDDGDVELNTNIEILQRGINLPLQRVHSIETLENLDLTLENMSLISQRLAEFWQQISASRFDVANLVLDSIRQQT